MPNYAPSCLAFAFVTSALVAQCDPVWLPGQGIPGVNGIVHATVAWDPDGAGPLASLVVLGGEFTVAGTVAANRIATFDPNTATWGALGLGVGGTVRALAVASNGDLVAGGEFTTAGGASASRVARWNGTSWQSLGAGVANGPGPAVHSLLALPNGDLVAGGSFTTAGGNPANRIARWNGAVWSAFGTGMDNNVHALATNSAGDIVAGGLFQTAGGVTANYVARWNGTAWQAIGSGLPNVCYALVRRSNGDLVAAGDNFVHRSLGSGWTNLLGPFTSLNGIGYSLAADTNGDVYLGGLFSVSASPSTANNIVRITSLLNSREALQSGVDDTVFAMALLPGGSLVVGGEMRIASGPAVASAARWNGLFWNPLGSGTTDRVNELAVLANGDVVAGGNFHGIGDVPATRVARWNGTSWSPMGTGAVGNVFAVAQQANGNVVIGGALSTMRSWDGTTWSDLGPALDNSIFTLTVLGNGDIVATGGFLTAGSTPVNRIARWNGSAWLPFGTGMNNNIAAVVELPNGELVAAGNFTTAGGVSANRIARWNGATWQPLGSGSSSNIAALALAPNGDLFAGGDFLSIGGTPANFIARWNGTAWSTLGSGTGSPVRGLRLLPDGDLLVTGNFTTAGGVPANRIARWTGSLWQAVGAGLDGAAPALALRPNGELLLAGDFTTAGGQPSVYLARLQSPCPPSTSLSGNGCGGGNQNRLRATTPPWVDATFRATGTGLPGSALVLTLTSVTSYPQGLVPLSLAFSQAGFGCDVLVAPDILGVLVTTTGTAVSQFFLPNVPPLVGVTFYHQMVPIELDGLGNWTSVQATNALQLTAGQF